MQRYRLLCCFGEFKVLETPQERASICHFAMSLPPAIPPLPSAEHMGYKQCTA